MSAHDGDPAFPKAGLDPWGKAASVYTGMSLRDYFAGEALPHALQAEMTGCEYAARVAAYAYEIADAMLAHRAAANGTGGQA